MPGIIQSRDYVLSGGTLGWRIDGDGNVVFNSGVFRGTIEVGSGINKAYIDASGTMFGDSSLTNLVVSNDGSFDGLFLRRGSTVKAFLGYSPGAGLTTLDMGGTSSAIQNVATVGSQLLRAFSSSDPRSTDAPLYSSGGAWIEKTLDVRGTVHGRSGSVSAVAFAPRSDDPDSGIYSDEADKVKIAAGGAQIGRFVNSGGSKYLILESGVVLRIGNNIQAVTSETITHFVLAEAQDGSSIKIAVLS